MADICFLFTGSSHCGGGGDSASTDFVHAMPSNVNYLAKSAGGGSWTDFASQGATLGMDAHLVHLLAQYHPNDTIHFGKWYKGGVQIKEFQRPGRTMYDLGLTVVSDLNLPCGTEMRALFMMQGTADRHTLDDANRWDTRMLEFIDGNTSTGTPGYRAELSAPNLHVYAGRVNFITENPGYMSELMTSFSNFSSASSPSSLVQLNSAGDYNLTPHLSDGVHAYSRGNLIGGLAFYHRYRGHF